MPKEPGFYFYTGDWLKEPGLRRCSKAAKGCWIDMLSVLSECPLRGVFATADGEPWTIDEIAEAIGGNTVSNLEHITELLSKGVCSKNGRGAIFSRRMVRDEQAKTDNRERVRKHRCNANVTPKVMRLSEEEREREKEVGFNPEVLMQEIRSIGFRDSKAVAAEHAIADELADKTDTTALIAKLRQIYAWTDGGKFAPRLHEVIRRWHEDESLWRRDSTRSQTLPEASVGQPKPFVAALPECWACAKEFTGAVVKGKTKHGPGLFCSDPCLAAFNERYPV